MRNDIKYLKRRLKTDFPYLEKDLTRRKFIPELIIEKIMHHSEYSKEEIINIMNGFIKESHKNKVHNN